MVTGAAHCFSWFSYYGHLASKRLDQFECHGLLMTSCYLKITSKLTYILIASNASFSYVILDFVWLYLTTNLVETKAEITEKKLAAFKQNMKEWKSHHCKV